MQIVNQTLRENIAANTTEENILVGTKLENVPTDDNYRVTILAAASSFDVQHKVEADTDVLVQPSIVGDTDRKPIEPDDFVGEFDVTGGSKLFLEVVNNDASNPQDYTVTITLTPLSML
jgi:hypothetical protein